MLWLRVGGKYMKFFYRVVNLNIRNNFIDWEMEVFALFFNISYSFRLRVGR